MEKIIKTKNTEAVVNTLGGEMTSCKINGREFIWYGDGEFWSGHAPVCFPFVSALKNGKVAFDGVEYTMSKKHGIARKSEFKLAALTENSASFTFASSDETKKSYPYDFLLTVTHTISDTGFKTEYKVKNTDDRNIVFCIGGHPGFCTDGSIEDWTLDFEKDENCDLYYTDADSLIADDYKIDRKLSKSFDLKYADFDVDAIIAKDINSRKVKLTNKKTGFSFNYDFSGFNVLVLWSTPKKEAPFIALEPWNGLPGYTNESGEFADKPYAITLAPGAEYTVSYSVSL